MIGAGSGIGATPFCKVSHSGVSGVCVELSKTGVFGTPSIESCCSEIAAAGDFSSSLRKASGSISAISSEAACTLISCECVVVLDVSLECEVLLDTVDASEGSDAASLSDCAELSSSDSSGIDTE